MPFLNLGILAHVDAGKTSLTERLLFTGGVIDAIGSVDAGTTRTDSLTLERRRGITIKTAVASFPAGGVTVNLIDTPGHPDFIAEVERALRVLDGAVLVISAVEGVQAQTRVLMRTLRRLRVPTLIFVNKIDRSGAREASLLRDLTARLTPAIIGMATTSALGTPAATVRPLTAADPDFAARAVDLADSPELLAAFVDNAPLCDTELRAAIAHQSRNANLHPVFFGSAATGAGVDALITGLADLLPPAKGDPAAPLSASVFKVDRDPSGARVAYVRIHQGTLRVRAHVPLGPPSAEPASSAPASSSRRRGAAALPGNAVVTRIDGVDGGRSARREVLVAGEIGKVHGLREVRIGDVLGQAPGGLPAEIFAPPTLETVVAPRRASEAGALHAALRELAEQDPLIGLRRDGGLAVSLYGEVQKEVIETTLAEEFGIAVEFRSTRTLHVERPAGVGRAGETIGQGDNPFQATLDLVVEPGPIGSGVVFVLDVPIEQVPIHVFQTAGFFRAALDEAVRHTLERGLHDWPVIDVRVTAPRTGFIAPSTTAADFRKLVPLVLRRALAEAGTVVCEPIHRFRLDGPADTLGGVLAAVGRFDAVPHTQEIAGPVFVVEGLVPAARLPGLSPAIPGLTRGEGLLETTFDSYRPVRAGRSA